MRRPPELRAETLLSSEAEMESSSRGRGLLRAWTAELEGRRSSAGAAPTVEPKVPPGAPGAATTSGPAADFAGAHHSRRVRSRAAARTGDIAGTALAGEPDGGNDDVAGHTTTATGVMTRARSHVGYPAGSPGDSSLDEVGDGWQRPGGTRIARVLPPDGVMSAWAIAVFSALSLALGYFQLSRPGSLFGVTEYDDTAYFGAVVRMVHGVMPYKDVVLVQPPGLLYLESPFALMSRGIGTRDALALARGMMPLVFASIVILTGLAVRYRGLLATVVACGFVALFPDLVLASRTLMLEPMLAFFCMLGVVLVFDSGNFAGVKRVFLGGLAFGFAGTVKGWAILPVLVVAALAARDVRKRLAPLLGGVTVGFVVPSLPFFVASPGAFVHQAVVLQLTRSTPSSEPVLSRLASLTGLDAFAGTRAAPISADVAVGACFAFVLVAGLLLVGPRRTSFEWFALGSTAVVTLGLLVPGEFFYHYAAFLAPFLGITVAIAVDRLCLSASGTTATGTPRNVGAHSPRRPPQVTGIGPRIVTGVAVLAAIVLCVHQFGNEQKEAYPDYGPLVATLIPSGACVVSDNAAVTLTTDRFVAASSACQPPADASGTSLSLDKGRNLLTPGSASPALIALWMGALRHADFVILDGNVKRLMPLDGQVKQYLDANFDFRATGGGLQIYQRD